MDWVESVREIRKANENNRLVVFVGAGVSKNSGIPTWGELIQDIAKKIGYSHCNVCKEKKPCSKEADCKERFSFTQDEYLRIPEYYFIQDHSEKHKAYYQLLQDSLGSGGSANAIDEEIFSLLPNHIVTTNYDTVRYVQHFFTSLTISEKVSLPAPRYRQIHALSFLRCRCCWWLPHCKDARSVQARN